MEGTLIAGIYVVLVFYLIKFIDIRYIQKSTSSDIHRPIIRDSCLVYAATVGGIYIATQVGGVLMAVGSGKPKGVFTGLPDF